MACYRLTYQNQQTYCLEIDPANVPQAAGELFAGVVYRVNRNVRDIEPVQRSDGHPLVIHSVTDRTVLAIAMGVLATVSGASLDRFFKCCDGPYSERPQEDSGAEADRPDSASTSARTL